MAAWLRPVSPVVTFVAEGNQFVFRFAEQKKQRKWIESAAHHRYELMKNSSAALTIIINNNNNPTYTIYFFISLQVMG